MTKSTFAIIIMGIVMVAMLAFGGTFAYFTAKTSEVKGSFTTGKISISDGAVTVAKKELVLPTETVISKVSFKNNSDRGAYLFVKVSATYGADEKTATTAVPSDVLNVTPKGTWTKVEGVAGVEGVYSMQTTDAAPQTGDIDVCDAITFNADVLYVDGSYNEAGSTTKVDLMGKTVVVKLEAYACQLQNATLEQALTAVGLKTA